MLVRGLFIALLSIPALGKSVEPNTDGYLLHKRHDIAQAEDDGLKARSITHDAELQRRETEQPAADDAPVDRAKCSPGSIIEKRATTGPQKRNVPGGNWHGSIAANSNSLVKRVVATPPEDQDYTHWRDFFQEQGRSPARGTEVQQLFRDRRGLAATGTTALFYDVATERRSKNWLSGELSGCTALYVASARGVYFAHFWENLAFSQGKKEPAANFELYVTNFLDNGGDGWPSLAQVAGTFRDQPGQARIFTPGPRSGGRAGTRSQGKLLYQKQIDDLKSKVKELTGYEAEVQAYMEPSERQRSQDEDKILREVLVQIDRKQQDAEPKGLIRAYMSQTQLPDITFNTGGAGAKKSKRSFKNTLSKLKKRFSRILNKSNSS